MKNLIRQALAKSSSQQPVAAETLYALVTQKKIEPVLLEMYRQQEVNWCKVVKHPKKGEPIASVVWWLSGTIAYGKFGRTGRTCGS